MRQPVRAMVFAAVTVLILPLFFLFCGLTQEPCYTLTYYGELPRMVEKLSTTTGKKVVIVGNSAVAFGVDSALMERLLREDGLELSVCNFGLYGVIGSKAMLDLSASEIGEGDIVLVIPEQSEHALSLYFSGREMWRAIDGDPSLFFRVARENRPQMVGNYVSHVAEKYKYQEQGIVLEPSGVYALRSFNDNCDMVYLREHNILLDGYDKNDLVSFDSALWQDGFLDYLNAYTAAAERKGARVCYAWCPINSRSLVPGTDGDAIAACFDHLDGALEMPIISDPNNYLLEPEWFYDSNFHLNSAGSTLYTCLLTDDLKSFLGDPGPTRVDLPEKPELPGTTGTAAGDNSCEGMFLYERSATGWTIVGLTEEGRARSSLVVPVSHQDVQVTDFAAEVFQGDTMLETLTIQENIRVLYDDSFLGCTSLRTIQLRQPDTSAVSVGLGLLNGADGVKILVPQGSIADYLNDYFWGHYAGHFETY